VEDILASIEIGTNSIRMLIAQLHGMDGALTQVLRKRSLTKLGAGFGTQNTGTLTQEAMVKSIAVLKEFVSLASQYGASSLRMVGTGILRRASNRDAFVDLAAESLGVPITIISGQTEAELTWKGVTACLDSGRDADIIFDLGGGSTEVIFNHHNRREVVSMDIGAVTWAHKYLPSDPPTDEEIHCLASCIDRELERYLGAWKTMIRPRPFIIATGGTAVTIAAMVYGFTIDERSEPINGLVIRAQALRSLTAEIKDMPSADRLKLRGLEPGREDIIVAGTLAVDKVMGYFDADEITVSYSDILEGILIDYMEGATNG